MSPKVCLLLGVATSVFVIVLAVSVDLWLFFDGLHETVLSELTFFGAILAVPLGIMMVFVSDAGRLVHRRWRFFENRVDVWHRKYGRSRAESIRREAVTIVNARCIYTPTGDTARARFLAVENVDPNAWILLDFIPDDPAFDEPNAIQRILETSLVGRQKRRDVPPSDRVDQITKTLGDLPQIEHPEQLRLGLFVERAR